MSKKFLLVFLLLLSGFSFLEAQNNSLKVLDPRFNTNYKLPGCIDELTIAIIPRGLYIEYEMYIVFSSKGTQWTKSTDSLEVECFFNLPENAFLIDSWLWYNDIILRAKLYDIWTASAIYENIVHRVRRDPSVIYRRSSTQYEMRIFPMNGDSYRKVKVSYMVPASWGSKIISAQLPVTFANMSSKAPSRIRLIAYPDNEFKNPRIRLQANTSYTFKEDYDSVYGQCMSLDLTPSKAMQALEIAFDSPMKNGVWANFGYESDEAVYQMAMIPSLALNFVESRKVVFLLDYNQTTSTSTNTVVEEAFENLLRNNLSKYDSFNVIFSGLEPKALSTGWISGEEESLNQALEKVAGSDLKIYSNLPSLLSSGIDFLNDNGKNGSIFIVSSSVSLGDYSIANELINDMFVRMKKKYPVFIADFATTNMPSYQINNFNYRGNEYLYTNMSRLTGGTLTSLYTTGDPIATFFQKAYNTLSSGVTSLDFHTTLVDGFCYGSFNLSGTNPTYNQPLLTIGKSIGEFPMTIEASGFVNNKIYTNRITVNSEDISFTNYKNHVLWNANMMRSLENKTTKTNRDILDIIDLSKGNRVLSLFTAFLALETDTLTDYNTDIDNDGDNGDDDNPSLVDDSYIVYDDDSYVNIRPNPFTAGTTIAVTLPEKANCNILAIEIFDLMGRRIRSLDIARLDGRREFSVKWLGDDDQGNKVNEGAYIVVITTATRKYTMKVLKI